MVKPRTSVIWLMPDEEFSQLVAKSRNRTEILNYFGFQNKGNNAHTLQKRIIEQNISHDHLIHSNIGSIRNRQYTNEEIFIDNSMCSSKVAVRRLVKEKTLSYVCECGNIGSWLGKKLSLQLDHINGKNNDHRLENLRWLCPNCHSQTDTFAGRSKRKFSKIKRENIIYRGQQNRSSKLTDELVLKIRESNDTYVNIAKTFNVSDTLVGKIRRRELWTHI